MDLGLDQGAGPEKSLVRPHFERFLRELFHDFRGLEKRFIVR